MASHPASGACCNAMVNCAVEFAQGQPYSPCTHTPRQDPTPGRTCRCHSRIQVHPGPAGPCACEPEPRSGTAGPLSPKNEMEASPPVRGRDETTVRTAWAFQERSPPRCTCRLAWSVPDERTGMGIPIGSVQEPPASGVPFELGQHAQCRATAAQGDRRIQTRHPVWVRTRRPGPGPDGSAVALTVWVYARRIGGRIGNDAAMRNSIGIGPGTSGKGFRHQLSDRRRGRGCPTQAQCGVGPGVGRSGDGHVDEPRVGRASHPTT